MEDDMNSQGLKDIISTAFGREEADLVLKNCKVLNVFTNELEDADVAVTGEYIVGVGSYSGKEEIDLGGAVVCPGLIDGHIHIESSMVSPAEFAKAIVPHGTTAVITDPHEIANVAGAEGINYMLERTQDLPLDVFFMLPSCVPATPMDESGAKLTAKELKPFLKNERVLGLAELMNAFGTVRNDPEIIDKLMATKDAGKIVDGHAPAIAGNELNAYVAAGVKSDHECSTAEEAIEKLKRGQWIMIREGTAAKNLKALLPLFGKKYYSRCMLVTDDKHPGDLITLGHIDYIVREAVKYGENPIYAAKMASFNAAQYFGLKDMGAIAPGYKADFIVVSSLEEFDVKQVYKKGRLVAKDGALIENIAVYQKPEGAYGKVYHSFHLDDLDAEDFKIREEGRHKRVIGLVDGELLTNELIVPFKTFDDEPDNASKDKHFETAPGVEIERDIIKLAVIERHRNTGHIGLGYIYGYGLKCGAIAASIAHDSHNLIIAGTNDADLALAGNTVRKNEGGLAIVCDGKVLGELPLPIAGLMCEEEASVVEEKMERLKKLARDMGVSEGIDPFMTLSFTSLPVIPSLRLTTKGLFDVNTQRYEPVLFS